jgi:hypothetical protein
MRREAEVLVRLHEKTESVVDVLTAGITEDDHQLPYYVMERLRGDTLRQFLADQRGRGVEFTLDEVTSIAIPLTMALSHAHALGIVHRDTKPDNIFMAVMRDKRVVVKVLDFGICATVDDGESNTFAGTVPYAAPEQLEGRRPTPATDIYALGLVIFELLTLKLPHGRHRSDLTIPRLAMAVLKNPIPDLAAIRLDAPPRLVAVVVACLAPDPETRPTALEVAKVLRDVKLTFLGELTGATVSMTAATDVTGPPIAVLQAQLEAAAASAPPDQLYVFNGSPSVDPKAPTDLQLATNEDFVLCRSPELEASAMPGASLPSREAPDRDEAIAAPADIAPAARGPFTAPLVGVPVITVGLAPQGPVPAVAPPSPPAPLAEGADRLVANQFVQGLIARLGDSSDELEWVAEHRRRAAAGSLSGTGATSDPRIPMRWRPVVLAGTAGTGVAAGILLVLGVLTHRARSAAPLPIEATPVLASAPATRPTAAPPPIEPPSQPVAPPSTVASSDVASVAPAPPHSAHGVAHPKGAAVARQGGKPPVDPLNDMTPHFSERRIETPDPFVGSAAPAPSTNLDGFRTTMRSPQAVASAPAPADIDQLIIPLVPAASSGAKPAAAAGFKPLSDHR